MVLYLCAVRIAALAFASMCPTRHKATLATGVVVTLAALGSGFAVQFQTMNLWSSWMRWPSPLRWTLHSLEQLEFSNASLSFECSRNPLTRQEAPGLVLKIPCGISNGPQALFYWAHHIDNHWMPLRDRPFLFPLLAVLAFWAVFAILQFTFQVCLKPSGRKLSRHKRAKL